MASQFQLTMRSGPTPGKVYELLLDDLTIGRDISNPIVVNDPEVSRRHSRLRAQAGGYVVEDMGSTNGTFVNGQRLMGPHMLRPGEIIMLGEHIGFVYEATYDPNATMASSPAQETYRVPQTPQTVVAPAPEEYPQAYPQQQYQPAYPPGAARALWATRALYGSGRALCPADGNRSPSA
jgi:pSer/pThr/pTyr-binding forkhead associated (FHA) protein